MSQQERVAYFDGEIVPESQVLISFRDRSFKYGDGVFDATRTFGGHPFKLQEHIDRLYRSLKFARIDPGLTAQEMLSLSGDVLARNLPLLDSGEDYWVFQRISRGTDVVGGDIWQSGGPTVIIDCTPLPLKARAPLFRDGIQVTFPSIHRIPPDSLSPSVKTHNYLNVILGDLEVRADNPQAWAVLLDNRGFLTEGMGSNVFLVRDGALFTPKVQYVLAGVTRQTVIELAASLDIPVIEEDLAPYDAQTADEAFITSTSFCVCPVQSFNRVPVGNGMIPGPVTKRLMNAFSDLVDYDYVNQYLHHLE